MDSRGVTFYYLTCCLQGCGPFPSFFLPVIS